MAEAAADQQQEAKAELPNKKKALSGVERAAVLLLSLGEQDAAEVMKHLGPKEVQGLGQTMAQLGGITREQVSDVLSEFVETVDSQTALGVEADDYIRNVLTKALGEDKADSLVDRILLGKGSKGLESLRWMEPRAVAEMIRVEHPQIIAIVLSFLEDDQSAEVLSMLPEQVRTDVTLRIATLDGIQPNALHELDEIFERQFAGGNTSNLKSANMGGIKKAADILNFVDSNVETGVLDNINDVDPELSQNIQDLMFVFDNLADIDDRSIQALLREVPSDTLITALKGSEDAVKDKVFKNMSKRAGEMLKDDLEAKGPVRLSDVEEAQKEILGIARRMAEAGDITLGGKGDQYV
ncbi:flagellar motor switch protein FliG [Thiohalospira halophila DSM 15071]|uniref:Flagellar motor switch protein FliG n=1 Tax=Thiohalospira halophila DSM 15071 TaxID=1123397 RepID=A0A1I1PGH4_9GAMM|nr:flagellar motor switch protein FliG [Thiohalospira halophila]SFD08887.1 flagellar motor switch protein FliG [Thiohalospira halophila DSM 15071]